jgi:hypothetical protein
MQRDRGQTKELGQKRLATKAFSSDFTQSVNKAAKTSSPGPELGVEKLAVSRMVEFGKGIVGLRKEETANEGIGSGTTLRSSSKRSLRKKVADKALGLGAGWGKAKGSRSGVEVEKLVEEKREEDEEGMNVDG